MQQKPNPNRNIFRGPLFYLLTILAVVGGIQLFTNNSYLSGNIKEISSSEFITQLDEGQIQEFDIQIGAGSYEIQGTYNESQTTDKEEESFRQVFNTSERTNQFKTRLLGNDDTLKRVTDLALKTETDVTTIPESSAGTWLSFLPFLILTVPALFLMFSMMRGGGAGGGGQNMMNFGKSKSEDVSGERSKVLFTDVAGAEEEKQELVEIVEFLKEPKRFTDLGARIPAGVLLEGPPGTGKTLLAKAVAGEAGVPFFNISGSEFVEMFVGVGASRIRDLFKKAKQEAPAIIFIDEIDAVGRQRGAGMGGGHDEREQTLNQLLVEMDGFEGNEGVIVMAATNRADVLDPALLRPGRFDRQIMVGNPDVKAREAILQVHARNKKLDDTIDLKTIAHQTPGFSGADLENLLNEAALVAARFNRTSILSEDVDEAYDRVIAGIAKDYSARSEKQNRTVAYHEAGHTVIGMVLDDARTVHKVTIVPRGRAGGYAVMLPKEDQLLNTEEELLQQVVGLLGGRVAEEIVFGTKTTGAQQDFQQATQIVRRMVVEFGMSDNLGPVQYESNQSVFLGRDYGQGSAYSDQIAFEIDKEVLRIMNECHERAHQIINEHRKQLNVIAEKLLEVETLDKAEIESLFHTGQMPNEVVDPSEDTNTVKTDDFERSKEKSDSELQEHLNKYHDKNSHEDKQS